MTTATKVFQAAVYVLTPHNYAVPCLAVHFSECGRPPQARHHKKVAALGCLVICAGAAVLGAWLQTWQAGESLFNRGCWRAAHTAASAISKACNSAMAANSHCRANCSTCFIDGPYLDIKPALLRAGCTNANEKAFCNPVASLQACPTHAALHAAATVWWPILLGLFFWVVVRRRQTQPGREPGPPFSETNSETEATARPGLLTRSFHVLAVLQVVADFCSCFALGRLIGQAIVPDTIAGSTAFHTGALCWGYGITAFGFVLLFGPASVFTSFRRATSKTHGWGASCVPAALEGLRRAAAAVFGCGMLVGLLYIVTGAALLVRGPAGYQDIYCWRYTGAAAAE